MALNGVKLPPIRRARFATGGDDDWASCEVGSTKQKIGYDNDDDKFSMFSAYSHKSAPANVQSRSPDFSPDRRPHRRSNAGANWHERDSPPARHANLDAKSELSGKLPSMRFSMNGEGDDDDDWPSARGRSQNGASSRHLSKSQSMMPAEANSRGGAQNEAQSGSYAQNLFSASQQQPRPKRSKSLSGVETMSVSMMPTAKFGNSMDMERYYVPKSEFDKVLLSVINHPEFLKHNKHLRESELVKLQDLVFPKKHVMAPAALLEEGEQYPLVTWVDGGQVDLCIVAAIYDLLKHEEKVEYTEAGERRPKMEFLMSLVGLEASITMVGFPNAELIFSPRHVSIESAITKQSRIDCHLGFLQHSKSFNQRKEGKKFAAPL